MLHIVLIKPITLSLASFTVKSENRFVDIINLKYLYVFIISISLPLQYHFSELDVLPYEKKKDFCLVQIYCQFKRIQSLFQIV